MFCSWGKSSGRSCIGVFLPEVRLLAPYFLSIESGMSILPPVDGKTLTKLEVKIVLFLKKITKIV